MLIKFSVDNFLSFRTRATLDLEAGVIKEYADDNIYSASKLPTGERVLKCLAIYGVNSSGKTNMLKAFSLMRSFVLSSSKDSQANEKIPIEGFRLNIENEYKATEFEAVFVVENKKFRYGFKTTQEVVLQEWLFLTEGKKEENLFIRSRTDYKLTKRFLQLGRGKAEMLTEITRVNALYLSVLAQFNNDIAVNIVTWFKRCLIILDANQDDNINYTANLLFDPKYNSLIHQLLAQCDLGFSSVQQEVLEMSKKTMLPEGLLMATHYDELRKYTVKTKHTKFNQEGKPNDIVYFDLRKNESTGTQRLFGLIGPMIYALVEKRVIWIDELDSRLNTNLVVRIVKLFNSRKENPNGAQLIFTSHNPYIMKKDLRRDQMIFVEKDSLEGSLVTSLYEKDSKIRNDASFDKEFLAGKYVDVPKLDIQLDLFDL